LVGGLRSAAFIREHTIVLEGVEVHDPLSGMLERGCCFPHWLSSIWTWGARIWTLLRVGFLLWVEGGIVYFGDQEAPGVRADRARVGVEARDKSEQGGFPEPESLSVKEAKLS
jgi:hypothetical protein